MTDQPSGPLILSAAERAQDGDFIMPRHRQMVVVAEKGFYALGPGAVVVDQLQSPPRIVYLPLDRLPETATDLRRMVATYQPDRELIVHLLKTGGRCTTYRLRRHLSPDRADDHDVVQ